MRKHHTPKRSKSPWGENRIGKYSIEEIALEFILWEDAASRDDATKRRFVQHALDQNFDGKDAAQTLRLFGDTYERLYEKIFHRRPDNRVMDATSGNAYKFADPRIKKQAA
jgi:hypothetical protein